MLNFLRQFFKIRVFISETKTMSPFFLAFLTKVTLYLTAVKV